MNCTLYYCLLSITAIRAIFKRARADESKASVKLP